MKIFKITGLQKITLEVCITGLKHYNFVWSDDLENNDLKFKREPNNSFDTNAIAVYLNNTQIGHISAIDSRDLAPIMDYNQGLQPYKWIRMHQRSNDGFMIIQLRMKKTI